jgi:hypothetical protein
VNPVENEYVRKIFDALEPVRKLGENAQFRLLLSSFLYNPNEAQLLLHVHQSSLLDFYLQAKGFSHGMS